MANWFKIFEVDLDETRMRYALSKLPETWPVWTAILMECCKHRADRFPWGQDEQELFGFSDRLKISIPKVNAAIAILCEIRYTELKYGILIVLKWNEKQDDYLARKSQGYWANRREAKKVTVNHSESHIEERRGEEIRREEKEQSSPFEIPENLKDNKFLGLWTKWLEHLKQKRKTPTILAGEMQLNKLSKMGLERAIAALENSISSNYQGVFEANGSKYPAKEKPVGGHL